MLLSLLLLATTAQAAPPEASCKSAYGTTACGYHCEAAYGQVACAQVPWGSCKAAYGQVVCGPSATVAAPLETPWPQATCVAASGKVACGYACASGYGDVGCAPAPWGACQASARGVTCTGDDPRLTAWVLAGRGVAPATCVQAGGISACGWGCATGGGTAACAPTPFGACAIQSDGTAVCAPGVAPALPPQVQQAQAWPQATCTTAYGKTACGYQCEAAYGDVRCASTPQGRCAAAYGAVTCWDPPALVPGRSTR